MADVVVLVAIALIHVLGFSVLSYWLGGRTARARRDAASGDLIMDFTRRAKRGAVGFAVFLIGMYAVIFAYASFPVGGDIVVAVGTIMFFTGLLGPIAVTIFGSYVRLSPAGIESRSPWSGRKYARWDDVESVTWSEAGGWYKVRTFHGTIRVDVFMNGVPEFLEFARGRISADKWRVTAPRSPLYRL